MNYSSDTVVCVAKGGYDDIREGAQVLATDSAGVVVGTSNLGQGDPTPLPTSACVFSFSVDVPAGSDFYNVEVSQRGALTFSNAEMVAENWAITFTLG